MTSHPPQWALEHIRADQATFRSEILSVGSFDLHSEPDIVELRENYVMIFKKRNE